MGNFISDAWKTVGNGTMFNGTGTTPGVFGGGTFQADPAKFNLPGFQQQNQQAGANSQMALSGQAPTIDQGQSNAVNGQQSQLAGMLMNQAQGNGPNPIQQQLQQNTQANVANAYAMAASHPNNGGNARNAAEQAAQANQMAAGQGAQLMAQQQLNAQGQLGGLLGQQRSQDLGVAGQQAQLQQNQFQLGNQAALGWSGQQLQGDQAQQQGQIAQQQLQSGNYNHSADDNQKATGAVVGGILGAGSTGLGAAMGKAHGGLIPGHAAVTGNSPRNDTVPSLLSPGEIVLPRSVTQSADAPAKAKAFLEAIKKKHRKAA